MLPPFGPGRIKRLIRSLSLFLLAGILTATWWYAPFSVSQPRSLQKTPAARARKDSTPLDCRELFASVCETKGRIQDPTGSVEEDATAELESHRHTDFIVRSMPKSTVAEVTERFIADSYTPKTKKRMREAMRWSKRALEHLIREEPDTSLSRMEKKRMIREIRSVDLAWPDPKNLSSDEKEALHRPSAHYIRTSRGSLKIILGGAYVRSTTSWFNLIFTLSHEIAHAIDPCEQKKKSWVADTSLVYPRLNRCFSVTGLLAEQVPSSKTSPKECGDADQRSEVFADWLGGKVTALALKEYSSEFDNRQLEAAVKNAVRDLCEPGFVDGAPETRSASEHPSQKIRIELLFARNPLIREVLMCEPIPPTERYCTWDSL